MPAYFFLQPATYNSSTHTTYPPFFALAAYNSLLLNSFDIATYSGNSTAIKAVNPANYIYITSAIQWQDSKQNWATGLGYYVEEWDFGVTANGSLTGSCTVAQADELLNACGFLNFPVNDDPLSCTSLSTGGLSSQYDLESSTIDAALTDTSGAVTIRGITTNSVDVVLSFNGTFWANSTTFSQLGAQGEHAGAPATMTGVWLYKPTGTAGVSKTTTPNAAMQVQAKWFVVLGGVFVPLSLRLLGAMLVS